MSEGSMTDSKDPVPQAWLKRSNSTPPADLAKVNSVASGDFQASGVGPPMDSVMNPYATHQPGGAEMIQQQIVPLFHQPGHAFATLSLHTPQSSQATGVPFPPSSQIPSNLISQASPAQIYIPPQQSSENMSMIMASAFHQSPVAPQAPTPQHQAYMLNQPEPAGTYQQTSPGNDGFEDELQLYMGGKEGRFLPANWNGTF
jgi:hypothetical protein